MVYAWCITEGRVNTIFCLSISGDKHNTNYAYIFLNMCNDN